MRRAVGKTGKVYAFEPQPELAGGLRELASASASFEPAREGSRSFAVDVTTLDEYFAPNEARSIRLLKNDAEGHELEVFRGARRLLTEAGPCILFEPEVHQLRSGAPGYVNNFLFLKPSGPVSGAGA